MKISFTIILFFFSFLSFSQSINDEKVSLANFIKRMYTSTPFEGVKIMDNYEHQYLVSIVSLDKSKYTSESTMHRVAQVKAQSQANTFLNGASISMEMIITTKEIKDSTNNIKTIIETVEMIKQNSIGFTQGLELLTNFDSTGNIRMVYIYVRELKSEK
jgi:hypothetical protein